MGMRERLQGQVKLRGIFRGIGVAALVVVINGAVALNLIPSSYEQFTWEAYAGVLYPPGTPCETPDQCESTFCVDGICCNTICDQPGEMCPTGTCATAAPAPAMSQPALLLMIALLVAIGFFALTPLRSGKRR
jgi:hypothetical protein